jgi:flagellar hook-associated protein 1
MALGSSLQIGRSGLLASQAALEVVGNNLANVATPGYHRQTVHLAPVGAQQIEAGLWVGRGVQVQQIVREIDHALEGRLRNALSDQSGSHLTAGILAQIEALEDALRVDEATGSRSNLAGRMEAFFAAWEQLQGRVNDPAFRTPVINEGANIAATLHELRQGLGALRDQLEAGLDHDVATVNDLLDRIERLNNQIARESGGDPNGAPTLRDQRDQLLAELSQYMRISTREVDSKVDIYVGSVPIMLGGKSRGVDIDRQNVDGELRVTLRVSDDTTIIGPTSGKLGAAVAGVNRDVGGALATIDQLAAEIIWETNRIHSQGQGLTGYRSITAHSPVADAAAGLGSDEAELDFGSRVTSGSFEVIVRQTSVHPPVDRTYSIDIKAGVAGTADTSLNDIVAQLNAVDNVTAAVDAGGRLTLATTDGNFELYFGSDSSGALAALGLNTFFTGRDAASIEVSSTLAADHRLLAGGTAETPNGNALAMAGLRARGLDALGGRSLGQFWSDHVFDVGARRRLGEDQLQADAVVVQNLQSQQAAVSGVNADEEAINLMMYQRAYQGNARFITVVDELMQTLLSIL